MPSIPPVEYYTSAFSGPEMDARFSMLGNTPQQALANLGAGVRPNLLDNPGLAVNQRGLSQYTGAVQTVDRWMAGNPCTWEKVSGGWKITQGTANGFAICQKKEKIAAGTYTISVIVSEVTGTWGLLIQNQQQGNLMITKPGFYSTTVTVNESDASPYIFVLYSTQAGDTITLPSDDGEVAKVEEGEGQTLFYKDEEGSWKLLPQPDADYTTQLLRCQRYGVPMGNAEQRASRIMTNLVRAWYPTPTPLRTNPVLASGSFQVKTLASGNIMPEAVWSFDVTGCGVTVTATLASHGVTDATISSNNAFLSSDL